MQWFMTRHALIHATGAGHVTSATSEAPWYCQAVTDLSACHGPPLTSHTSDIRKILPMKASFRQYAVFYKDPSSLFTSWLNL
jgi:ferritin-like protein